MINFIKQAVESVEGIKAFLFNTDYRNNFDLQNVEFPCCVLTPIMRTNYNLNNIIRESAELQLSVVDLAPYEYTGNDLYEINKRCSDLALQVIANLQVKSKLDKELTFEFILPSGDELISGVMCNLQCTMKQGSCIGKPSYVEVIVQPIKRESITSNGKHIISADSGFNAMREVEVDVNVDIPTTEEKSVIITRNGEVEILPTNADAMTKVTANVQVPPPPLEEKQVTITKAKTTEIITPDTDVYGLSRVEVSTDIPLESKQITITENGATTIEASEGFEGIESIEVTTDVNTLQGLDFEGVFDQEQANEINQYYKDGIAYAENIRMNWTQLTSYDQSFFKDTNIRYFPNVSFDGAKYTQNMFGWSTIEYFPKANLIDVISSQGMFYYCARLKELDINMPNNVSLNYFLTYANSLIKVNLHDVSKVKTWINFIDQNPPRFCKEIKFVNWKNGSILISTLEQLAASSIHYIIQNAVDLADGATARTLTLHATAKTNWQNSKYYAEDLAVLSTKGITIA